MISALGHRVLGPDLSPAMAFQARAKAKAAGVNLPVCVLEASAPPFAVRQFDAVVCRHLLWALPDPAQVLTRWAALLKPGGRLILIEGHWHTGAGLRSTETISFLPPSVKEASLYALSGQSALWGGAVTDERYAVVAVIS